MVVTVDTRFVYGLKIFTDSDGQAKIDKLENVLCYKCGNFMLFIWKWGNNYFYDAFKIVQSNHF